MRYRLADTPALFATPVGRSEVIAGLDHRLWPVAAGVARVHRRTVSRNTCLVVVVGSLGKTTAARALQMALLGAADAERRDNLVE